MTCIADDVPAIGRIALTALPHVRPVVIRVHYRTASHQFHDHRVFPPHALAELLHRAYLAMGIDVLTVGDAYAYERLVFRRAHRDAPNPVAFSKKMMSRKIWNVGSVLLLEALDTAQNFRIEIHQPEPENIFLLLDGFLELQLFCEHSVPAGGIDEPPRLQRLFFPIRVPHGNDVQTSAVDFDSRHRAIDQLNAILQVASPHFAVKGEAVYLEREYRRRGGNFVHNVSAICGIVDIPFEVIGQAVFWKVLFHEVSAEPELEQEIDTDLDQRFADDRTILARALNHRHLQVREALPQVRGRKLARCSATHNYNIARHRPPRLKSASLLLKKRRFRICLLLIGASRENKSALALRR